MKNLLLLFLLGSFYACSPKLAPDHGWANQAWVLVEMNGVPVQVSGTDKDAHLVFFPNERTYAGTGGCNRIRGAYALDKGNKIKFNNPAGTLMACQDSKFENKFIEVLLSAEKYGVSEKEMIFSAKDAIVMKFEPRALKP